MNLRNCLWLLALCACTPAVAQFRTVVEAKETSTAYINLPATEHSRLIFKTCDDCEYISVFLTPATEFYVRGVRMDFAAFRTAFLKLGRSKEDYALVSYETETNTAKSVRVAEQT